VKILDTANMHRIETEKSHQEEKVLSLVWGRLWGGKTKNEKEGSKTKRGIILVGGLKSNFGARIVNAKGGGD